MALLEGRVLSAAAVATLLGCAGRSPEPVSPAPDDTSPAIEAPARPLAECRAATEPLPPPTEDLQRRIEELVEQCQALILDEQSSCKAVRSCSGSIDKMRDAACTRAAQDESWAPLCAGVRARQAALAPCVPTECAAR